MYTLPTKEITMKTKKWSEPKILLVVSVAKVLDAVGILGLKLIRDMEETDPNEWYQKWIAIADDFESALMVMHEMETRYRRLFDTLMFPLPDGVSAVEVPNPLREEPTKKRTSKDEGAYGDETEGDTSIPDEPPF